MPYDPVWWVLFCPRCGYQSRFPVPDHLNVDTLEDEDGECPACGAPIDARQLSRKELQQ